MGRRRLLTTFPCLQAAPVIRTKPLPEFTTPPSTSLRSSPSPSAAETAPTAPSTVLPPFASNAFDAYSTISGSPFSTTSKPAFATSSTTTTSSACFSRFDSYVNTTTSTSTSFSALASRPSVFGGSGKTNTTPRAYTFAETKPSASSVFSGFASTPESFMPAAKPSPPQLLQQVVLDGDVDEEVDELAEETEPVGDGALTSVTPNIEEAPGRPRFIVFIHGRNSPCAPVNTGEEREVVLMAVCNASLHTWRDGKWTISAVPVNARWLRDIVDDTERIGALLTHLNSLIKAQLQSRSMSAEYWYQRCPHERCPWRPPYQRENCRAAEGAGPDEERPQLAHRHGGARDGAR